VTGKYKPECISMSVTVAKSHCNSFIHKKSRLKREQKPLSLRSILFVEDEQVLRTMVSKLLTHLGYNVITAMNEEQVLEVFDRNNKRFDILITDVIMPKMDGKKLYQLLEEIAKLKIY